MPDLAEAPRPRRALGQVAVILVVLGSLVGVAILADERVLVADPDPSVVTAADVRLARSLLRGAVPLEALAEVCIAAGSIDPACLGDGGGPDERGGPATGIVPRSCRRERSISADCLEQELGLDVPAGCVDASGGADVSCVAGAGTLLVLSEDCLDHGRLRVRCLTPAGYGIPDRRASEGSGRGSLGGLGTDGRGSEARGGAGRDGSSAAPGRPDGDGTTGVVDAVVAVATFAATALLLGLAFVVAATCLRALAPRRTAPAAPLTQDEQERHDRVVMAASVDAGVRRLAVVRDNREAIIEAYAALLEGLSSCAQGRRPSETPLEHVERVLGSLEVRSEPLLELAGLFAEARFSTHPMSDEQRRRARAALEVAAAELGRVREPVG